MSKKYIYILTILTILFTLSSSLALESFKKVNSLTVNIDKFADSIISHNTYHKELLTPKKINYYIIDKDKDSVLGPLTKEEFEKVKKEKSIDLEFDEKK